MTKEKKYLGIDWGEKRIGLATGDSEVKIASPFKVVDSMDEIIKTIKEEDIDIVIVGEPLKMQSTNLKMQNEFIEFLELLKKKVNLPIDTVDERLSSKAADALEGDKKTKAARDATAAMIILQTFFDKE